MKHTTTNVSPEKPFKFDQCCEACLTMSVLNVHTRNAHGGTSNV